MAKIYTKTGDSGETDLLSGERVSKGSALVEVIGVMDECNAALGMARSVCPNSEYASFLETIQKKLFVAGVDVMNAQQKEGFEKIEMADVLTLELWIDQLDAPLPPLKAFVLPGGSSFSAYLHFSRTVVRKVERRLVALDVPVSSVLCIYFNRLSDFLFVWARHAQWLDGE